MSEVSIFDIAVAGMDQLNQLNAVLQDDARTADDLDFLRRYTSDVANLLRRIDPGPVMQAIAVLHAAWQAGKVVLFCGNGGSGASCSHIVNDFQKGCRLRALCLSDCTPLLTADANDADWNHCWYTQVNAWGEPGGVLVLLSGSGNSKNVLAAQMWAHAQGMVTIGLSGFDGGALKEVADVSIHVATESMQQAEDVHMVLLHVLYLGLKRRIEAGK